MPYGVIESVRAWNKYEFIELVHRLDRDTSGVLLLAKSRPALLRAQKALKEGGVLVTLHFEHLPPALKAADNDLGAQISLGQLAKFFGG